MREMKDSGVEWIGKIPTDWTVVKLNNLATKITDFVASGSFADLNNNVEYLDDPDYAMLVRTADLSGTKEKRVYINEHAYDFLKNSNLFGGEIILSNIGSVGNVFIYKPMYERSSLAPNAIMIDGCPNNKYVYYWFINPIANDELKRIGGNAVQLKFNKTQLRQFKVLVPPIEEQKRIVDYLDSKCSKIDATIEKQQAIIVKLKEYKLSAVTEAVTKGLDPDVKMKDSEVEWIGKIPENWGVYRIANLYDESVESGDESLPILTVSINSGISDKELSDEESDRVFVRSEDKTKYKRVRPGYLAYNMMRAWQGAFGAARVDGMVSPAYIVAKAKNGVEIDSRYIEALLRTPIATEEMHRYSHGIADFRLRLYWPEFKNIRVCIPPMNEQVKIADYIDDMNQKIDCRIEVSNKLINKLSEYKKSLIYEVVTGKKEV